MVPKLALIEQAGQHDGCPEVDCVDEIDVGGWRLTGPAPHSAAIETSAIAAGA